MRHLAVIGAGLIGRSWAIVFARAGCAVALYDGIEGVATQARAIIADELSALEAQGMVANAADALARIRTTASLADALAAAEFVQECTPENLAVKREIFAELDRLARPDAILASSTSGIVASKFTEQLAGRARCLVAHPVNPPHLIPLVELVGATWTSPQTLEWARALYSEVGQVPIIVRSEIDGFILNRLQAALLTEAFRLVGSGYVSPQDLDKTVKDGLGLRWAFMGPFETIELNAPAGIPDYCARYGPTLASLSRAAAETYGGRNLAAVMAQWPALPDIPQKMLWRDRQLAALRRHKQAQS